MHAIEWDEAPYDDGERLVLTFAQTKIPGLRIFGKHTQFKALPALPNHFHKNCFELVYITKGTVTFYIGDEEYLLSGGEVFLVRPDEVHSSGYKPLTICEMYWMQLDICSPTGFLYLSEPMAEYLLECLGEIQSRKIATDATVMRKRMRTVEALLRADEKLQRMEAACQIQLILHQLIVDESNSRNLLSDDIRRVVEYIHEHIEEQLDMELLSKQADLSISWFKQKFKQQIGNTPRAYINSLKVEQAKQLLRQGVSVTDTAMQLGFDTSSYFSVVFKRFSAKTPTEYIASQKP